MTSKDWERIPLAKVLNFGKVEKEKNELEMKKTFELNEDQLSAIRKAKAHIAKRNVVENDKVFAQLREWLKTQEPKKQ